MTPSGKCGPEPLGHVTPSAASLTSMLPGVGPQHQQARLFDVQRMVALTNIRLFATPAIPSSDGGHLVLLSTAVRSHAQVPQLPSEYRTSLLRRISAAEPPVGAASSAPSQHSLQLPPTRRGLRFDASALPYFPAQRTEATVVSSVSSSKRRVEDHVSPLCVALTTMVALQHLHLASIILANRRSSTHLPVLCETTISYIYKKTTKDASSSCSPKQISAQNGTAGIAGILALASRSQLERGVHLKVFPSNISFLSLC
jgi:hypothetical protein